MARRYPADGWKEFAVLDEIEDSFAGRARTPKGVRALRAVFRATTELVAERGVEGTSLEAIASDAGLTQAALRHYFATREELLTAFFVAATEWFRDRVTGLLTGGALPARQQLERCVATHLEYMEGVETVFWLESSAYWVRHPPPRRTRDTFYSWLVSQYAQLIGSLRPSLSSRECEGRAYAVLTLVLGAWITHGRGSAVTGAGSAAEQRQVLVDAAMEIAIGSRTN